MTRTIPAKRPGVISTWYVAARKRCPVADEVDLGDVTVAWATTDVTLELHALAELVATYRDVAISHEDFVADLAGQLAGSGVELRSVGWDGETAGGRVFVGLECDAVLRESLDAAGA